MIEWRIMSLNDPDPVDHDMRIVSIDKDRMCKPSHEEIIPPFNSFHIFWGISQMFGMMDIQSDSNLSCKCYVVLG